MKKYFLVILLALALTTAACSNSTVAEENTENQNSVSIEAQNESIDYSALVPAKEGEVKLQSMGTADLTKPYETVEDAIAAAEVICLGTVETAEYVLDGSTVYTKSVLTVEKSYKGDLTAGDEIVVKELDGFIPSDKYNEAVQLEKYGEAEEYSGDVETLDIRLNGYKVLEKGERVILLLLENNKLTHEGFEGTTYESIRLWQGKYLYDEAKDLFIPYIPEDEIDLIDAQCFTETEFSEFIF